MSKAEKLPPSQQPEERSDEHDSSKPSSSATKPTEIVTEVTHFSEPRLSLSSLCSLSSNASEETKRRHRCKKRKARAEKEKAEIVADLEADYDSSGTDVTRRPLSSCEYLEKMPVVLSLPEMLSLTDSDEADPSKLENLEYIGDGLPMSDYAMLVTETQNLGRLVEETIAELHRLHIRYIGDLHILGHMRERQLLLRQFVQEQTCTLTKLNEEKKALRSYVGQLNTEQINQRNRIRELSIQCGLIDKPALMEDYVVTVQMIRLLRDQLVVMKEKRTVLQTKIEKWESISQPTRTTMAVRKTMLGSFDNPEKFLFKNEHYTAFLVQLMV